MSNEATHTHGPWKVSETEMYAEIYGAIPNRPPIALVQSSPEDIRLIASAPDLLRRNAELEELLKQHEDGLPHRALVARANELEEENKRLKAELKEARKEASEPRGMWDMGLTPDENDR